MIQIRATKATDPHIEKLELVNVWQFRLLNDINDDYQLSKIVAI